MKKKTRKKVVRRKRLRRNPEESADESKRFKFVHDGISHTAYVRYYEDGSTDVEIESPDDPTDKAQDKAEEVADSLGLLEKVEENRKRRSMREKRVMKIKRGLMKRAKKLRLGAKRTGAYVYGTLRRIVGNRSLRRNEGLGYTSYIPESGFLVAKTTGYHDTPSGKFQLLKKGQVLRILFTTKERRGGGTTGKEYFVAETTDHPYEGMKVLVEKGYAGKIYNSDPRKSSSRYGNRLVGNPDHRTRIALQTVRRPMEGYFLGGPDLEESVRFLIRKGYTMAQLKKINPDVEDELSGKKSILPNSRRAFPTPRFVGKGEYVWKKLTPSQKLKFIMESPRGRQSTPRSQELFASRGWNFLPRSLKIDLESRFANVESDELMRNPMRSSFDKPTFGPFNTETRRVDTTTMAGMREAERLHRAGWYQGPVTLFSTTYYRKSALPKSSIARQIRRNPPMYAHGMMSHRTHGLSLKQMMKLYRLVSSGNPKAVMFARRTLGIPMSESLSQVKAVVYHHILDLKGKI